MITRRTVSAMVASVIVCSPVAAQTWGSGGVSVFTLPNSFRFFSSTSAVNNSGQIAGYEWSGDNRQAILASREGSGFSFLRLESPDGSSSWATSLNNRGQVVGAKVRTLVEDGVAYEVEEAFLYDGSMTGFGSVFGGTSVAYGINDAGLIVGAGQAMTGSSPFTRGFTYDGTSFQVLGTLGGTNSLARAVSSNGMVVGQAATTRGMDAVVFEGTTARGLGTPLGRSDAIAWDVNRGGKITGYYTDAAGFSRGFLHDGALRTLSALGLDESSGHGIDQFGRIIGSASSFSAGVFRAALWERGSGYFLDDIVGGGWKFSSVSSISDNGRYILGLGSHAELTGGVAVGVLLEAHGPNNVVPEPLSVTLLGTGLAGVGAMARRRRKHTKMAE